MGCFRLGDYVDVVNDSSIQKGMCYKFYHGKTGVIWNVTKRSVGVIINKQVGGRIKRKKIHVRIEHVRPSNCRKDFLTRVRDNEDYKRKVKAGDAPRKSLKRSANPPKPGGI